MKDIPANELVMIHSMIWYSCNIIPAGYIFKQFIPWIKYIPRESRGQKWWQRYSRKRKWNVECGTYISRYGLIA
ncbi:hypothetical protein ACS0TY_008213 [Phlomoides rotata]